MCGSFDPYTRVIERPEPCDSGCVDDSTGFCLFCGRQL